MNQFNTHCDLNGTTPIHQSAYKQFHSCESALIKIVNDALWALEHRNITIFVGMDLSMTFDTVNHTVLLKSYTNALEFKMWLWNGFVVTCHLDSSKLTKFVMFLQM